MMRHALLWLPLFLVGCAGTHPPGRRAIPPPDSPIADAQQLLLVVTPHRDSATGWLRRFRRDATDRAWTALGPTIPIEVGRNGLAWGRGLHPEPPAGARHKVEGDGRAPAGAFRLDGAFGTAPAAAARFVKLPYRSVAPGLECVDDRNSAHYNRLVRRADLDRVDWRSSERMDANRYARVYRWGITVAHNRRPVVPGAGSCIFLHIGDGRGDGTSGCTAMAARELLTTLIWLDPLRRPVLVQLPREEYSTLRNQWGLP